MRVVQLRASGLRVVIDTNILISGLLAAGSLPARLIVLWRLGRFNMLTSMAQLDEMMRVTRYPKLRDRIVPALAGRLINDMRELATMVPDGPLVAVSPDPDDDYLLALASAGGANFLVTGDKRDVLGLGRYRGAEIIGVRAFLDLNWARR